MQMAVAHANSNIMATNSHEFDDEIYKLWNSAGHEKNFSFNWQKLIEENR